MGFAGITVKDTIFSRDAKKWTLSTNPQEVRAPEKWTISIIPPEVAWTLFWTIHRERGNPLWGSLFFYARKSDEVYLVPAPAPAVAFRRLSVRDNGQFVPISSPGNMNISRSWQITFGWIIHMLIVMFIIRTVHFRNIVNKTSQGQY